MKHLFLVLCIAGTAFISCKSDQQKKTIEPEMVSNPASAEPANADTSLLPKFDFESDNHEFGPITEGEIVSYNFKFKNSGKAPLIITQASASCGCTVPEYSKDPIAPGQEGFIKVTFNSEGKHGMTSKTITLLANTIPNTKVLTISADISKKDK
ncbi:MAG TPA: DUF1573 domain-containing protein [Bacteroidia bacterium]|nr:DUF1573 domain-containing protein [Bacteroidia bacterium]